MERIFVKLNLYDLNQIVDYDLNHAIQSFIYGIVTPTCPYLHDANTVGKFTFSLRYEKIKCLPNGLKIKSKNAVLILSSIDGVFINAFKANINYGVKYKFNNLNFSVTEIVSDKRLVTSTSVHLRTINPVFVTGKNKKTLNPTDIEYKNTLINNLLKKHSSTEHIELFILEDTIKSKYIKIKNNQSVKAHNFDFFISTKDIGVINTLLYSGLGSKNSIGFGMCEIVNF